MRFRRKIVVLDAADIAGVSAFWAQMLDARLETYEGWHALTTPDGWELAIQLAPDHVPPDWPDGQPQQIHIDLYVDDIEAAHEHVMACGARHLQDERGEQGGGFVVYADPAGHPFCLCWQP